MDFIAAIWAFIVGLFTGYGPVVIGWGFNLIYMVTACIVIVLLLRYLDKSLGIGFKKDVLYELQRDPKALAIYFAARFIGACLLAGLMLGSGGGG